MAQKAAPKNPKAKSSEEIFSGFQTLRGEQRQLANKITELEMDLNEHKYVRTIAARFMIVIDCTRLLVVSW